MLKQAVFLVGGLGTRLGDLTRATPKPLLTVAGRPFIDFLIDEAARHGFTDIVLLAGHLGEQFHSHYDGLRRWGATVRVVVEPKPMGTGGAVRMALPHLDETFLLANGDSFFDINLRALTAPAPGTLTMALRATAPGARYGTVGLQDGCVVAFHRPDAGIHGPINAGIYLISRSVVAEFPEGRASLENERFPALAAAGRIRGTVVDGYFIDMGIPEDFERAQVEMPLRTRRPAVFFDRDGTLNVDHGYVHRPEQFQWLPGAREAIRACNDRGCFAFVVTNQAGVAHGYYDESAVVALHDWMAAELARDGAHVDAFEYCPHHTGGVVERYKKDCRRRKPAPGMIQDLLDRWPVDIKRSVLIGDRSKDMAAAQASGIRGVLYEGGNLAATLAPHLPSST